jgi:hypothetical protein
MTTNIATRKPAFAFPALPWLMALVAVFLLGGAGGYLVKGAAAPASVAPSRAAVCPTGTHVVVWYTARSWGCVPDGPG